MFDLSIERDYFLSLKQCRDYVEKELEWPTATVTMVSHNDEVIYQEQPQALAAFPFGATRNYQRA